MDLVLVRTVFTNSSTIGTLFIDGKRECFTLEDVIREVEDKPVASWKIFGVTAIPRGKYKVIISFSNHFMRDMMELVGVPGFSGVRIHSGNVAADTEGCIIVGTSVGRDRVNNSGKAKDALFAKVKVALDKKETVTITIK